MQKSSRQQGGQKREGQDRAHDAPRPVDKRVQHRIEDWKRKLVDLSRRNRLIFFRPSRTSSLRVLQPPAHELFEHLAIRERSWRFWSPPVSEEIPPEDTPPLGDHAATLFRSGQRPPDEAGESLPPRREFVEISVGEHRGSGEVATQIDDPGTLVRILKNLHRRSRTDFEERGVRILHLAFGMLDWRDPDHDESIRSPLVLVPVELARESAADPFELRPVDDEIVLNPGLDVKLRSDFRLELPAPPDDWHETPLEDYLKSIEEAMGRHGWTVSREVWLGLFSFHKLVIYRDLTANEAVISGHSFVRALAGCPATDGVCDGDAPRAEEMDRLLSPDDSFLILDADSSQLACIEAVKNGTNLVVHGPPGTGKSQTIANVIAEILAAGKTVLFVSEKMAALEVVFGRLKAAHLDHYCLELHSHKANKREVVQELYRSLSHDLEPGRSLSRQEVESLTQRRTQLGDYVRALHVVREPLQSSAFDVLGQLASLHEIPFYPFQYPQAASLGPAVLTDIDETTSRLQTVWHVVQQGREFPWWGCRESSYAAGTRTTYQRLLSQCQVSLSQLRLAADSSAERIGLPPVQTLKECAWLVTTLELLTESSRAERSWLVAEDLGPYAEEAESLRGRTELFHQLSGDIGGRHGPAFFDLCSDLRAQMPAALNETSGLLSGKDTDEALVFSQAKDLGAWASDLAERTAQWESDGQRLVDLLDLPSQPLTSKRIQEVIRLADLGRAPHKPESAWLAPAQAQKLADELPRLKTAYEAHGEARGKLRHRYTEDVLGLELDRLAEAFSGRYVAFYRWLLPGYYRDRRAVARCSLNGRLPPTVVDDLALARDVKRRRQELDEQASEAQDLLCSYYQGYDTDFDRIESAISIAFEAMNLAGRLPLPDGLRSLLSVEGMPVPAVTEIAGELRSSLSDSQGWADKIGSLLSLARLPTSSLPPAETSLPQLREWAENLARAARRLSAMREELARASTADPLPDFRDALADLDAAARVREIAAHVGTEAPRLDRKYGPRFRGTDTKWQEILDGLEWARRFREHVSREQMTEALLEMAVHRPVPMPGPEAIRRLLQQAGQDLAALEERFEEAPVCDGKPLGDHNFERLAERLSEMERRLDEIRDWIGYRAARQDFERLGLGDLLEQLEEHKPAAALLPRAVRRPVLDAWMGYVFEEDSALSRFRGEDHRKVVEEFRELDRKHWRTGCHRVIARANERKPHPEYVPGGSELQLLRREALKQRRHLPIRKLVDRIPRLITRLKPCLLMSPLSVSQFLGPDIRFDVVVFDEASQICSEDAVGAIYRGSQVLVCGDNKQLPPTAFFHSAMSEEFYEQEEDADEHFDPLPSVLEECLALGMREGWLRWHYRSQHESLIAFSNRQFYDSRLVTFPSSERKHPDLGVEWVHVSDGVYDRGGRRNNEREAEVIADLVFDHFRRHQTSKSLGVVALSQAQMVTIEDEIERRLRDQPEMRSYFARDRTEHFFVKNLENVQGDERDVIILSIGYGKDRAGRLTMNFGPLNQAGGERRLNVAITRARRKVILVSSIGASDIRSVCYEGPRRTNTASVPRLCRERPGRP